MVLFDKILMSRKKRSHNISEKANVSVTVIPLNYEEHGFMWKCNEKWGRLAKLNRHTIDSEPSYISNDIRLAAVLPNTHFPSLFFVPFFVKQYNSDVSSLSDRSRRTWNIRRNRDFCNQYKTNDLTILHIIWTKTCFMK